MCSDEKGKGPEFEKGRGLLATDAVPCSNAKWLKGRPVVFGKFWIALPALWYKFIDAGKIRRIAMHGPLVDCESGLEELV